MRDKHPNTDDTVEGETVEVGSIFDTISDAASGIADVATSAIDKIPGGQSVREAAGDFAKTTVGHVITTAIATTLYLPFALHLGPQMGAIVFAVPGLIRGEKFTQAWLSEFSARLKQTAQIMGPSVGELVGTQTTQVLGKLSVELNKTQIVKEATGHLADRMHVRDDAAAYAKSAWNGDHPPPTSDFDLKTGRKKSNRMSDQPETLKEKIRQLNLRQGKKSLKEKMMDAAKKQGEAVQQRSALGKLSAPPVLTAENPTLSKVPEEHHGHLMGILMGLGTAAAVAGGALAAGLAAPVLAVGAAVGAGAGYLVGDKVLGKKKEKKE